MAILFLVVKATPYSIHNSYPGHTLQAACESSSFQPSAAFAFGILDKNYLDGLHDSAPYFNLHFPNDCNVECFYHTLTGYLRYLKKCHSGPFWGGGQLDYLLLLSVLLF